eukprot:TRINITY_DN4579_c0_g1_i2.p1 TRINITY_DN4579_c0_g1~~TRINITY_DN4579_c0_g1_i2.p1  ORF type:complete len:704 (-),score=190.08 TRINITY_DN4579_c0_g1_i2:38-2149(-)
MVQNSNSDLSVKKVTLHRYGRMHTVHEGKVESGSTIQIKIDNQELEKITSSFTALEVSANQNKALPIQFNENPVVNQAPDFKLYYLLDSLLVRCIGTSITITTADQKIRKGIPAGYNDLGEKTEEGNVNPRYSKAVVFMEEGTAQLSLIPVRDVLSVDIHDKKVKSDLDEYLKNMNQPKKDQDNEKSSVISVITSKEKEEEQKLIRIQYASKNKSDWKMIYHVVLPPISEKKSKETINDNNNNKSESKKPGRPMVLIFGQLANETLYDWNDVKVTLVSGGNAPPPTLPQQPAQVPQQNQTFGFGAAAAFGAPSFAPAHAASSFGATVSVPSSSFSDPGLVENVANLRVLSSCEQFEIDVPELIQLKKGKTTLIPIIYEPLQGEQHYCWNSSDDSKMARISMKIVNTTRFIFEQGPITFVDSQTSSFIAESVLPCLMPKEDAYVHLGTSRLVTVEKRTPSTQYQILSTKISKGNLIINTTLTKKDPFRIKNKSDNTATVMLDHPYSGTLDDESKKKLSKGVFKLEVPRGEMVFHVTSSSDNLSNYNLLNMSLVQIASLERKEHLSGEMVQALQNLSKRKIEISKIDKQIEEVQKEGTEAKTSQERSRTNLKSFSEANQSDLAFTAGKQIMELETKIESLLQKFKECTEEKNKKYNEMKDELEKLEILNPLNWPPVEARENPYLEGSSSVFTFNSRKDPVQITGW